MIASSAPGKLHLIGEHAVVYGEPAILTSVGLRTYVSASKSDSARYVDHRYNVDESWSVDDVKETASYVFDTWRKCSEKKNFSDLISLAKKDNFENFKKSLIGTVLNALHIDGGVYVDIRSDIPPGAGMGSSASLSVALVKSISEEYHKTLARDELNNIALEMEKIMHGMPSGGDNSACCYGGLIWFQKSSPTNIIKSLSKDVPYKLDNFVAVYTKPPEKSTGELVQLVKNLDEGYRNQRIKEIGRMTYEMLDALTKRDMERVKDLMNRDQKNLFDIGVSIKEIDDIAYAVKELGGGAKLCGAGGGGMMLCYHKEKNKLVDMIKQMGYKPVDTELGVEGVRLEN
jgi:mevalonate kinase